MAQTVYSVNAVGYVNLVIQPGFSIIANPLDAGSTNNTIANLFPGAPNNFAVYKFNPATGAYSVNRYKTTTSAFSDPTQTLVPGEGAFVNNPLTTPLTNTFVGTVMSGALNNPIVSGFSIISSQVPQAGKVQADLGLIPSGTITVYKFNNATGAYSSARYFNGTWPSGGAAEPSVGVGEGFFVNNASGATMNWARTFSIGN